MDYMLAPLAYARDKQVENEEPVPLLQIYALTFPMGIALTTIGAASHEDWAKASRQMSMEVAGVLVVSCASAVALNFLGGFVLRDLGASAQQIVGKLNTICIAA